MTRAIAAAKSGRSCGIAGSEVLMHSKLSKFSFFATILLIGVAGRQAVAAFVFNVSQVGTSVDVSGAGSFNLTGLNPLFSGTGNQPQIQSNQAFLSAGPISFSTSLQVYSGISGPSQFGDSPIDFPATSGSGDAVGTVLGTRLQLPKAYVSGTLLSDTNSYSSQTFSSMGLTPGVYVYTWGSGATADSLTINIGTVPEPMTLSVLAVPASLALLRRRRGLR